MKDGEPDTKRTKAEDERSALQNLAEIMTPSIVKVVEFAKRVPGFKEVSPSRGSLLRVGHWGRFAVSFTDCAQWKARHCHPKYRHKEGNIVEIVGTLFLFELMGCDKAQYNVHIEK